MPRRRAASSSSNATPTLSACSASVLASGPTSISSQGTSRDLASLLADLGVDRVDHVVSGLPVPSLPLAVQQALFQAVGNVLRGNGTFNQITEIPWLYWRFYRRHFDDVQFVFEPRNLPPAGAYFCRGSKA